MNLIKINLKLAGKNNLQKFRDQYIFRWLCILCEYNNSRAIVKYVVQITCFYLHPVTNRCKTLQSLSIISWQIFIKWCFHVYFSSLVNPNFNKNNFSLLMFVLFVVEKNKCLIFSINNSQHCLMLLGSPSPCMHNQSQQEFVEWCLGIVCVNCTGTEAATKSVTTSVAWLKMKRIIISLVTESRLKRPEQSLFFKNQTGLSMP